MVNGVGIEPSNKVSRWLFVSWDWAAKIRQFGAFPDVMLCTILG